MSVSREELIAMLAELVDEIESHDNIYDEGLSSHHASVEKARTMLAAEHSGGKFHDEYLRLPKIPIGPVIRKRL